MSMPAILSAIKGWTEAEKIRFDALAVMLGGKPSNPTPRVAKRKLSERLFDALFPGK